MNNANVKPFERIFNASLTLRRAQLSGEIGTGDVSYLEALLWHFSDQRANRKPVTISIFTGGGSLDASLAIYDLIQHYHQFFPIDVLAIGPCMSGGVIVMQAGRRRLAYPHARFMTHAVQTIGNPWRKGERNTEATEHFRLQARMEDILAVRTRVKRSHLRGRTERYFSASEAVKVGLIDRVVSPATSTANPVAHHGLALEA